MKFFHFSELFFTFLNSFAQDDSQSKIRNSFTIDGAFCITTEGKAAYINMGGAQVKFDFNHKVALAMTLLPSLGIKTIEKSDGYSTTTSFNAVPFLGIGPQVFVNKWIFSFPFYYKTADQVWVATAGIGYKIQYSKTQ